MRTKYKDKSFLKGVGYCLEGISYTFNNEKNFLKFNYIDKLI